MLGYIGSLFVGRAAKAGIAALISALGAPTAIAGAEAVAGTDLGLTILGYVVVGALQGLISWAGVFFAKNEPTDWQAGKGLY